MPPLSGWRDLYPFASHFLTLAGQRLHYLDEGPRDAPADEVCLFVHGNPTWSFYWRNLVLGLRHDRRAVALDHLGCGLSDKPQDYSYCLAQHIHNLLALIEHLDLRRITLFAHDWGGAIGLGAAIAQPERFARLVLFNTAAFRSRAIPWRIRVCRTPLVGPLAVRGLNLFARAALRMALADPSRLSPEARAGLLFPYSNWQARVAIQRFVEDIPVLPSHPSYATLAAIEAGLPRLALLPCALIWGMRDWCFTPHFLARFRQIWPHAQVHELADAGHYVVEEAHAQILPIVQTFLAENPLAASKVVSRAR